MEGRRSLWGVYDEDQQEEREVLGQSTRWRVPGEGTWRA